MENSRRYIVGFACLGALLVALFMLSVGLGSQNISAGEILNVFAGGGEFTARQIILEIRLPRAIAATVLGGGLALAGYLLQTFFNNPIAGPFVLGISSGAKLIVALVMIFFLQYGIMVNSLVMILAAFIGSMISMGFILLIAGRVNRMSVLIICGIMIGYICSAVTDFAVTFADDSNIVNLHNWSLGSFSGIGWGNVRTMTIVTVVTFVLTIFLSKPMDAFRLGESYARSAGVNIKSFRVRLILLSSILAATVTAFAGPISFVGIAVPHLIRNILKSGKPIVLIPACFLGGSVFCLFSDLLARMLFAPTELSISTVTSVFGAPIVINLMIRKRAR